MTESNSGASAHDNNAAIGAILEQYNSYIVALAWKSIPRNVILPDNLSNAVDELAQSVRIKLWLIARKQSILHPKAYIRRIVRNEVVNIVRQYKPLSSLPINEEGELYQGNLLISLGEGMHDPLEEVEQEEVIEHHIALTVEIVQKLPPRQQRAMICSLKDRANDTLRLIEALRCRKVNIESMDWPEEKEDVQRLKASLPTVREKLRSRFSSSSS